MTRAVFLHGYGADKLTWAGVRPVLENVDIVSPDLPGHSSAVGDLGDGSIDDLGTRVLTNLDSGPPAWLVGHSLGGGIALWLANQAPELWKGLILLAPLGLGKNVDQTRLLDYPSIRTEEQMRSFLESLVTDTNLIKKAFSQYALLQLDVPGGRASMEKIVRRLPKSEDHIQTILPNVARHRLDITVIWGIEDTVMQPDASRIETLGKLVRIPNIGHIPHVEAMKDVNAILKAKIL